MKIYVSTIWLLMLILVGSMSVLYVYASKGAKRTIQRQSRRASFQNNRFKARAQVLARKELRVVNLFGLLLFFFVAAYLPILYINFCDIISRPLWVPAVLLPISLYLLIVNSVLNPILCIMLKKDYLYAIKKIFMLRYTFTGEMAASSRRHGGSGYEDDDPGVEAQTPDFNRRGTFRKKGSTDNQRRRMVSDQSDYSSRTPFLKKTSTENGRPTGEKRQRMVSDQTDYANLGPSGAGVRHKLSGGGGVKSRGRVESDTETGRRNISVGESGGRRRLAVRGRRGSSEICKHKKSEPHEVMRMEEITEEGVDV